MENEMRLKMIMTYVMLCSAGIVTAGCSSLPFANKDPNKTVEVPAVPGDNIPQWFLEKEQADSKFIVVTATDISKDMQFAIDKATHNAKLQIASRLKSDIDAVVRESTLESGAGVKDTERDIDRVSKIRTKQAIGFFKRENLAVFREGDHYRAYVMFKISIEDARRLTHKPDTKNREERFKELEEPVAVSQVR